MIYQLKKGNEEFSTYMPVKDFDSKKEQQYWDKIKETDLFKVLYL